MLVYHCSCPDCHSYLDAGAVIFYTLIWIALILITAAQLTGCATSAGPFLLIYGMNMALVGIVNVTHLTYQANALECFMVLDTTLH